MTIHLLAINRRRRIGALLIFGDYFRTAGAQIGFLAQSSTNEFTVAFILDRFRQRFGKNLRHITFFELLKELHDVMQMTQLVLQKPLPDRFDAWVRLIM